MFADRPWERAHSDDVTVDLDDLGDRAYVAFADDEPGAFSHELRVGSFVEVRPRQAGFVFAVEVNDEVELGEIGRGFRHG